MLFAFIRTNLITGNQEVAQISTLNSKSEAEVIKKALGFNAYMEVDSSVKLGMVFVNYTIYDSALTTATQIFPPKSVLDEINNIKVQINPVDEDSLSIDELKEYRIAKSKQNLSDFFNDAYIMFNGGKYSVTESHQTRLFMTLGMYEMITNMGGVYPLHWNERGGNCRTWIQQDLVQLSIQITQFVTPYISAQQTAEQEIMAAETIEDVKEISIDFTFIPPTGE